MFEQKEETVVVRFLCDLLPVSRPGGLLVWLVPFFFSFFSFSPCGWSLYRCRLMSEVGSVDGWDVFRGVAGLGKKKKKAVGVQGQGNTKEAADGFFFNERQNRRGSVEGWRDGDQG